MDLIGVQQLFLSNLSKASINSVKKPVCDKNNVFNEILAHKDSPEIVSKALGELGTKLLAVASKIDVEHPLLAEIGDGELISDGKFRRSVKELLDMASNKESKNWENSIEILRTTLNKDYKSVFKKIPLKIPPRLISDKALRDSERKNKFSKVIQISFSKSEKGETPYPSYSNIEDEYFGFPDTFKNFVRMNEFYKEDLFKKQKNIKNFQRIGLDHQIEKVQQEMKSIKDSISDTYCDFIRIKMKDAAIMLARSLGFKFENGANKNRILVPKKIFGNHDFWNTESFSSFDPWNKASVDSPYLQYAPRAYPMSKFKSPMPDNVKKIFHELEEHVSTNGKPLFDYYWVIVPSVQIQGNALKIDGTVKSYSNEWELFSELDSHLVNNDLVCPIILGENSIEKKCYFICYWI